MKLPASYFPYEMSADKDGLWSFSNRHGFPVGVNLSEHDAQHLVCADDDGTLVAAPRREGAVVCLELALPGSRRAVGTFDEAGP